MWTGVPCPSQIRWCFKPGLPRLTGDGPVPPPPFRVDVTAVHRRPRPVDPIRRIELRQQKSVHPVERISLGSSLEPPPAGRPGAENKLLRQLFSPSHGMQHEQDALRTLPIR
jgi:hypothetical protein